MRVGLLLIVLLASHATSAFGATVVSSRIDESDDGPPQWTYTVQFKAAKGERNRVSVHLAEGNALVRDRSQRLRMRGGFCARVSRKSVRCPADLIYAELRDGADELKITAQASDTVSTANIEGIVGGAGDDTILLGYGGIAVGGTGDDLLDSDADPLARGAILNGGKGRDRVTGSLAPDDLNGGRGDDVIRGRRGRDRIGGGSGEDRLYGGAGPDRLADGDVRPEQVGPDRLIGGPGRDLVESYRFRRRAVFVNLAGRGGGGQRGEGDSLAGIENVLGGFGDDKLLGDGDGNKLVGGDGDDVVHGRGGRDTIDAMEHDRVRGGDGGDNIRTSPEEGASVRCDAGADRVTSRVMRPLHKGPLVDPDCERIERRRAGSVGPPEPLVLDPVPPTIEADGDMTFAVIQFACCEETLELTRPARPFGRLDSAPVDANEVTVTAPADLVEAARTEKITLRMLAGPSGQRLVWRFRVGG